MTEFFFWLRIFNFAWAFVLFWTFIWWGVIHVILRRNCNQVHIPPEFDFWIIGGFASTVAILIATSATVLSDVEGGIQTFTPLLVFIPITTALHLAIKRVKFHRISVEKGLCS